MLATRSERGQPEVHVVLRPVYSVYQVSNDAWVFPVGRQDIDIRWVGHDVDRCDRLTVGGKDLDTVEADVVTVAPRGQDVNDEVATLREHRDLEVLLGVTRVHPRGRQNQGGPVRTGIGWRRVSDGMTAEQ